MTDGTIRNFADPTKSFVEFDTTLSGQYHIVVRHRNHLAIMDSALQVLDGGFTPVAYDFSTRQSRAYGTNPMAQVALSRFAMIGGDGNIDGGVDAIDRNTIWQPQNGLAGYLAGDFNLDGGTDAIDRNTVWKPNNGTGTQVP
jgi:hypothetical protein